MNRESMSKPNTALSIPADLGLILGLAAIATIVASGIGYRLGWWHFTRGLQASEWATYGAAVALVAAAGAVAPGTFFCFKARIFPSSFLASAW